MPSSRPGAGRLSAFPMRGASSIFLIGPMGSGKSTVGKELASRCRRRFIDSDEIIVDRCGMTIAAYFKQKGESGFRALEQTILEELTQISDIVLATGGGAVLSPVTRKRLKKRGTVVYLHPDVEVRLARLTATDTVRPLLEDKDPREALQALDRERTPLYREVADYMISTDNKSPQLIADEILRVTAGGGKTMSSP